MYAIRSYYVSASANKCIKVTFNSFNTESCCDKLYIGPGYNTLTSSTTNPKNLSSYAAYTYGTLLGSTIPSPIIAGVGQAVYAFFYSDGSVVS